MWTCFVRILNLIYGKLMAESFQHSLSFNTYISLSAQHTRKKISTNMAHNSAERLTCKDHISGKLQFWFLMRPCFVGICIIIARKYWQPKYINMVLHTPILFLTHHNTSVSIEVQIWRIIQKTYYLKAKYSRGSSVSILMRSIAVNRKHGFTYKITYSYTYFSYNCR